MGGTWGLGPSMKDFIILDDGSDESGSCIMFVFLSRVIVASPQAWISFFVVVLSRVYPALFNLCPKEALLCDACELAKHTKGSHPSINWS